MFCNASVIGDVRNAYRWVGSRHGEGPEPQHTKLCRGGLIGHGRLTMRNPHCLILAITVKASGQTRFISTQILTTFCTTVLTAACLISRAHRRCGRCYLGVKLENSKTHATK